MIRLEKHITHPVTGEPIVRFYMKVALQAMLRCDKRGLKFGMNYKFGNKAFSAYLQLTPTPGLLPKFIFSLSV